MLQRIQAGLAAGQLQVGGGAALRLHDAVIIVDDDHGRRKAIEEQLAGVARQLPVWIPGAPAL